MLCFDAVAADLEWGRLVSNSKKRVWEVFKSMENKGCLLSSYSLQICDAVNDISFVIVIVIFSFLVVWLALCNWECELILFGVGWTHQIISMIKYLKN